MTTAELMKATALDTVFAQFGAAIADARRAGRPLHRRHEPGLTEASARSSRPPACVEPARALDDKFTPADYEVSPPSTPRLGARAASPSAATELTPAEQTARDTGTLPPLPTSAGTRRSRKCRSSSAPTSLPPWCVSRCAASSSACR